MVRDKKKIWYESIKEINLWVVCERKREKEKVRESERKRDRETEKDGE